MRFADLHPNAVQEVELAPYRASFALYRKIIGAQSSAGFDRTRRYGTPAAIFHAYFEAYRAGLESSVRDLFSDVLQIGIANRTSIDRNPVEWAKAELQLMMTGSRRRAVTWIKTVCDKQPSSTRLQMTNDDVEELIWWRSWRAPKFIHMRPSGNTTYNAATAWTREDEPTTLKLLDGLSERFTQFVCFHLDSIAGKAHVELAKQVTARIRHKEELRMPGEDDWKFARLALEEARKSVSEKDGRPHPMVGAVVVRNGEVLASAHRGEAAGNHAEYIAVEKRLGDAALAGATVYTTLEPCTTRNHPKIPCADRLVERKIHRVVIGMLDPNPEISGRGQRRLRGANIITDFFPHDLMAQAEEMNREFSRRIESEFGVLRATSESPRVIPEVERQDRELGHMYKPQPQPVMLRNRGKSDALAIQIQPLVLTQGQAHFRQISILSPGESMPTEVEIRGPGGSDAARFIPPLQRKQFHNLEFLFQAEWDSKNDLSLEMMRIPFSVSYSDAEKNKFLTNGVLIYHPHGGEIEIAELEFGRS